MTSTDVERLSNDCYMFTNECKHAANTYQAYTHSKGLPIYVVVQYIHFDMRASWALMGLLCIVLV